MIIYLTAREKTGEIREFSCQLDNLETAFDFVSDLSTRGQTLLRIMIEDGSGRVELPAEAFDGSVFSSALLELQSEWSAILEAEKPCPASGGVDWCLLSAILNDYEELIVKLELNSTLLNRLHQQTQRVHPDQVGLLRYCETAMRQLTTMLTTLRELRRQLAH